MMEVVQKVDGQIVHAIYLKADDHENVLYAYVEFFNAYRFIVLLNSNYIGKSFEKAYIFNVIKREEVSAKTMLNLNKKSIDKMVNYQQRPEAALSTELNKVMPLIMKKQESDHINGMLFTSY